MCFFWGRCFSSRIVPLGEYVPFCLSIKHANTVACANGKVRGILRRLEVSENSEACHREYTPPA